VKNQAFSVIEMVIAAAVLMMAAGVMLPLMTAGRRQARILTCAGNLETIGQAMEKYLDQHRYRYPTGPLAGGEELAEVNLLGATGWPEGTFPAASTPAADRPLNACITELMPAIAGSDPMRWIERVAHCPMDGGDSFQAQDRTLFEAVGCSYVYPYRSPAMEARNAKSVFCGVWAIQGHNRSEIAHPDRKLIVADTVILANRPADLAYNQWHNSRDPLEANILFADGHVANLPRKTASAAQSTEAVPASQDELARMGSREPYY
jgi:prepilin-type processing-associated H-X9-DG protein